METEILQFATNNGTGVFFGCLMFYMANHSIQDLQKTLEKNTEALHYLIKTK